MMLHLFRSKEASPCYGTKPFARGKLLPITEARQIARTNPYQLVDDVSNYRGAREGFPEQYPGKRPPASYLYLKRRGKEPRVHLMAFEGNDPYSASVLIDRRFVRVSKILKEMGAEPLEDQYLLIGYGSNPCPGQIRVKIEQSRQLGIEGIKDVMVVFRGMMHGYVPVTESFSEAGYPYAGILRNEETRQAKAEVWATLLTRPMLEAMNISEYVFVDPENPAKYAPESHYAIADGYPFQFDGVPEGNPLIVNTAGYTGTSNIYTPEIDSLEDDYKGPLAFDTIHSVNHPFPSTDVFSIFSIILKNMAADDSRYELDRLLSERWIDTPSIPGLTDIGLATSKIMDDLKALSLMRWMNKRWRIIENKERPYTDRKLVGAIREHMGAKENSYHIDMMSMKTREGAVFSGEAAYSPDRVKFGNIIPP